MAATACLHIMSLDGSLEATRRERIKYAVGQKDEEERMKGKRNSGREGTELKAQGKKRERGRKRVNVHVHVRGVCVCV